MAHGVTLYRYITLIAWHHSSKRRAVQLHDKENGMQSQMNDTFKHPEFPFIPEALVQALDKAFHSSAPT
jgi:hypothetical protein